MVCSEPYLPLAAIEDWMRVIVPLLFVIFWVIQQVFGGDKKPQPPPKRRPKLPPDAPGDAEQVRNELQDFLREAAQRQNQGQPRPVHAAAVDDIVEAEIVEPVRRMHPAAVSTQTGDTVPPVGKQLFAERVSHLGEEVAQADEKVESHLHEVFDHDVGRMPDGYNDDKNNDDEEKVVVPKLAYEIRELFRRPKSVRQAIVLSEVLRRPDDRW